MILGISAKALHEALQKVMHRVDRIDVHQRYEVRDRDFKLRAVVLGQEKDEFASLTTYGGGKWRWRLVKIVYRTPALHEMTFEGEEQTL